MAKKFNLREFQTNLSRQLQAATTRETVFSRLGFQVGNGNWLVALDHAEEVIPVPTIIPVPGTQRWFRGMANIRGNLFAVTDFSDFLHGTPTPDTSSCRLVIAHHQFSVNSALLVSRTLGLKNASAYQDLNVSPEQPWIARKYRDSDQDEWRDLDFPALLNNAEFLKVEADARS